VFSFVGDKNPDTIHFVGYVAHEPVAVGRVIIYEIDRKLFDGENERIGKLERIAVRKEWRKKGYATVMTKEMIDFCVERGGCTSLLLHSQVYAKRYHY
jgi:GNAT superfamily N-acetyltransferase